MGRPQRNRNRRGEGSPLTRSIDLVIHHHGSFCRPRMEYVGGEVMTFPGLDISVLSYSHIITIVEVYLGYQYGKVPALYYKVDDYEEILELTRRNHVQEMFRVFDYESKNLHVFVDHGDTQVGENEGGVVEEVGVVVGEKEGEVGVVVGEKDGVGEVEEKTDMVNVEEDGDKHSWAIVEVPDGLISYHVDDGDEFVNHENNHGYEEVLMKEIKKEKVEQNVKEIEKQMKQQKNVKQTSSREKKKGKMQSTARQSTRKQSIARQSTTRYSTRRQPPCHGYNEDDQDEDEEDEQDEVDIPPLPLTDFEDTDGMEDDAYINLKNEEVLRAAREAAMKWFKPLGEASSSAPKEVYTGKGKLKQPNEEGVESPELLSLESDENVEGTSKRKRRKYPEWHGLHDLKEKVEIYVGQLFANPSEFKEALQLYAVQNCFDYTYMHNDKQRVSAYCKQKCGWRVYASWKSNTKYFQIKTLEKIHNCGSHYFNKRASIKWAANRYIDSFRDQPNWKASALKEAVRRDYNVELTLLACHRAKRMALKLLAGSDDGQYKLTRAYCNALRQWNPGSSTYIQRNGLFFKRMYVSLDACKRGFLAGCRPMICVDACFMKGQHGGQLHAAIARDGNDDIFPIAYALCETESRGTWTWFLNTLLEDIGNPREHTWSFMSDRQKGLMEAIEYLMPDVEHRLCVRHLHANFKNKGYKGKAYKDALWGAARASNENQFKYYMSVIKGMDTSAHEYIVKVNPKMWSRHAFRETSCSDILLNNTAETFNAWVLEARDQPILTCMEMIRRQLMNRISQKRNGAATSTNIICPKIVKKLDRNKSDARNYISHWSNDLTFEVDHSYEARRVVNLKSRTCGCGRWQKNGIPCPHACCAIYQNKETPEKYVSDWYLMDTYKKSYAYSIEPMPGPKDWAINNDDEVTLPPLPKKQRGRPKKVRRRGADENEPNENEPDESVKVSRKGYDVRCGNCNQLGHNARSCTRPQNPNRKIYPKKVKKPQLNTDTEGGTSQTMHPTDIPQSTATASGQSRRSARLQTMAKASQTVGQHQPHPQSTQFRATQ